MTPYYSDDAVTIYHGDCRDLIDGLEFDVIVTDPPYGIDYGNQRKGSGALWQTEFIVGDESTALAEWLLGLPMPMVVFGAHEFAHLLPSGGHFVCWDKRVSERADAMPGTPFELAWSSSATRHRMIRCQHGGAINANGAGLARVHPTEKPVPVMRRLIDEVEGAMVMDPFMGSGTTLRAAKDLNRRAIGIEIDERYCEIAARRCSQEVLAL